MAGPSTSSGELQVLLHPLVVINITDHATRFRVQNGRETRVFGALFGTQQGRSLEVHTSFELVVTDATSDAPHFDMEYLTNKSAKYSEVFKQYEVLGWYTTGNGVQPGDAALHRQLLDLNENAILLTLDINKTDTHKQSPIKIYESVLSSLKGAEELKFSEIPHRLEVVESERIALDHVTRYARAGQAGAVSSVVPHMASVNNAVSLLNSRLRVIVNFLTAVQEGRVKADHKTMRQIASLWYRLPRGVAGPEFEDTLADEHNDAMLVAYLASLTKCVTELSETMNTFQGSLESRGFAARLGSGGGGGGGGSGGLGFIGLGGGGGMGRRSHPRQGIHF